MNLELAMVIFALIVFVGYAVQTITGFGSTLILVTFGAHLLDLRDVVTLAVPISLLQTIYIVVRHRDGVDKKLLFKRVLPVMGLGVALSIWLFSSLESEAWLRTAFGAMVLVLGLRELYALFRKPKEEDGAEPREVSLPVSLSALLGAGIIHGIYATGGPLLVYAIGRENLDKHTIRSTLSAVWVVLNILLLAAFTYEGRFDASVGMNLLVLAPAVPLGIFVGEWAHRKVNERRFKISMYALLVLAALSLLIRQ